MRALPPPSRVRPMRPEDIPQVLDIERASFPTMWPQTVYQRELQNKMARYLVAYTPGEREEEPHPNRDDGPGLVGFLRRFFAPAPTPTGDRILGMAGLWCAMGEGHIVTIAVRPELRRLGIGEMLLVAALEAAVVAAQHEVTLEYRVSNSEARAMYQKYGFQQVGVRTRYYSDNQEDAVLMTTPPLRSSRFRALITKRIEEQQARWGDGYPLAGKVQRLTAMVEA